MPDGESHESIPPLQREVIDLSIQLSHADRLGVEHVFVDWLVESFFESSCVEIVTGLG